MRRSRRAWLERRSIKQSIIGIRPENRCGLGASRENPSSSSRANLRGRTNIGSRSASAACSMCTRWTARSNRTRPARRTNRRWRRGSDPAARLRRYRDTVRPRRRTDGALTCAAGALTSRAAQHSGPRAPHRLHSPWRSARARRGCAARAKRSPWHQRDSARRDRVPDRLHRSACAW